MPLKIAPKGEISPTLRTGVMNWGDVFRGRVHIIRKTNTVDFAYSDFDYNDSSLVTVFRLHQQNIVCFYDSCKLPLQQGFLTWGP